VLAAPVRRYKRLCVCSSRLCQRAEQRHVGLATEEQDFVVRIVAQHADIVTYVIFVPSFIGVGAAGAQTKGDVVMRRQKTDLMRPQPAERI
jgi:hypothetical protein